MVKSFLTTIGAELSSERAVDVGSEAKSKHDVKLTNPARMSGLIQHQKYDRMMKHPSSHTTQPGGASKEFLGYMSQFFRTYHNFSAKIINLKVFCTSVNI